MAGATFAGAVIAIRQPRHPVGWLHLFVAFGVLCLMFGSSYGVYGGLVRPGALPLAPHLTAIASTLFVIPNTAITFVLLLTPTGSFLSARWRGVGIIGAV